MLFKSFKNRHHATTSMATRLSDPPLNQFNGAIYVTDDKLQIRYVNEKACEMTGYSRKKLMSLHFSQVEHELRDKDVASLWLKLSIRPEGITFTSQHTDSRGKLFPVEISTSAFTYKGEQQIMSIVHDVRELCYEQEQRNLLEKQLQQVVINSPDVIARFNLNMRCIFANPTARRCFDLNDHDIQQTLTDSVPYGEFGLSLYKLVSKTLVSENDSEAELIIKDHGEERVIVARCVAEYDMKDKVTSVLVVGRDITAKRRAEDELRIAHHQLRMLARSQELRTESERKQLARDIHDELGQHLTSIRTGLSLLSMKCEGGNRDLKPHLENLTQLVDNTILVVRDVSSRLRPNVLNLGLIPSLEWLCDQFIKNCGCKCILIVSNKNSVQLDELSLMATFRIVQESLTNATRHACASSIYIIIKPESDKMDIEVVDNGKGFDINHTPKNGYGLLGIKERAKMLNGNVAIISEPGKGTRVKFSFPITERSITEI